MKREKAGVEAALRGAALLSALIACQPHESIIGRQSASAEGSGGAGPMELPLGPGGASAVPFGLAFEAESGEFNGDFSRVNASDASGGAYLTVTTSAPSLSEPGPSRARYRFSVDEAGDYVLFVRVNHPLVSANRVWFRVDQEEFFLWRLSTGEEWFWDDAHEDTNYSDPVVLKLAVGEHQLEMASATSGVRVDRFALVPSGAEGPKNQVACDPPHAVLLDGQCIPSCGSYKMASCERQVCAGKASLLAYDCDICCRP